MLSFPAENNAVVIDTQSDGIFKEIVELAKQHFKVDDYWSGLNLFYDPIEVSEKMIIGVGLTSRYFPCFLDWTEPYGGSNDPFFFTDDMISIINEIRDILSTHIPEMVDSVMSVAMLWY